MERVSDEELAEYAPGGDDAGLMAREIRAYRESGALEALRGMGPGCGCNDCDRDREAARRAAIAKLEAIESGAVDESNALKAEK